MTRLLQFLILSAVLLGCTDEKTYPLSGEECQAGDPVAEVRPPDCATLPTGLGTL
jgi:hypothetical protein